MTITTEDDQPRIEGTQVTVADVISLADYGYTPREIAEELGISAEEAKEALDYANDGSTNPSESDDR